MKHIMCDIETMGTKPGSAIISIGACQFDLITGQTGKEFYINIDLKSCQENGFSIDASTVLWWMNQSDEARESLKSCQIGIEAAIESFHSWMEDIKANECQVWANSPSFDLNLLEFAFNKFGLNQPWFYWNERDCRTLVSLAPEIKKSMVNDLTHDALSDCKYQIKYCSAIYNSLNIETLKNQNNG